MFDIFKKKSCEKNGSETKLSESEIEQLKQELEQKKEEFRSLYNELIEAGVTELPEDILDQVAGGGGGHPINPTLMPAPGDDIAGADR